MFFLLSSFTTLRREPANITGSHNQLTGFFVGQPFDISQIINAPRRREFLSQRTCKHHESRQFESHIAIQLPDSAQIFRVAGLLSPRLLPRPALSGQCVLAHRALAQCLSPGRLIKAAQFPLQFFLLQAT